MTLIKNEIHYQLDSIRIIAYETYKYNINVWFKSY